MHRPVPVFTGRMTAAAVIAACAALIAATPQAPASPPIPAPIGTHTENGLAGYAKILCSGVFVSGRAPEDVARGSAYFFMPTAEQDQVTWTLGRAAKVARASLGEVTREARYHGDQGCIIENPASPGLHFTPAPVKTTLPDAASQPWPMGDRVDATGADGGHRPRETATRPPMPRSLIQLP